mgnify:CR=1 FL=1
MINDLLRKCIAPLCSLLLTGCNVTFESNQYRFLKSLFETNVPSVEKSWAVTWRDRVYTSYAINYDGGTLFANQGGLLVTFDGWQIVDLAIPGSRTKKDAAVTKEVSADGTVSIKFANGRGRVIGNHSCRAWEKRQETDSANSKGLPGMTWVQQCSDNRVSYKNKIRLNGLGQLIGLQFVLVPGVPPIKVELL